MVGRLQMIDFFFDPNNYTRTKAGSYVSKGGRYLTEQQYQSALQKSQKRTGRTPSSELPAGIQVGTVFTPTDGRRSGQPLAVVGPSGEAHVRVRPVPPAAAAGGKPRAFMYPAEKVRSLLAGVMAETNKQAGTQPAELTAAATSGNGGGVYSWLKKAPATALARGLRWVSRFCGGLATMVPASLAGTAAGAAFGAAGVGGLPGIAAGLSVGIGAHLFARAGKVLAGGAAAYIERKFGVSPPAEIQPIADAAKAKVKGDAVASQTVDTIMNAAATGNASGLANMGQAKPGMMKSVFAGISSVMSATYDRIKANAPQLLTFAMHGLSVGATVGAAAGLSPILGALGGAAAVAGAGFALTNGIPFLARKLVSIMPGPIRRMLDSQPVRTMLGAANHVFSLATIAALTFGPGVLGVVDPHVFSDIGKALGFSDLVDDEIGLGTLLTGGDGATVVIGLMGVAQAALSYAHLWPKVKAVSDWLFHDEEQFGPRPLFKDQVAAYQPAFDISAMSYSPATARKRAIEFQSEGLRPIELFIDKSKWKDHPKKPNYVVSPGGLVRTKAWLDAKVGAADGKKTANTPGKPPAGKPAGPAAKTAVGKPAAAAGKPPAAAKKPQGTPATPSMHPADRPIIRFQPRPPQLPEVASRLERAADALKTARENAAGDLLDGQRQQADAKVAKALLDYQKVRQEYGAARKATYDQLTAGVPYTAKRAIEGKSVEIATTLGGIRGAVAGATLHALSYLRRFLAKTAPLLGASAGGGVGASAGAVLGGAVGGLPGAIAGAGLAGLVGALAGEWFGTHAKQVIRSGNPANRLAAKIARPASRLAGKAAGTLAGAAVGTVAVPLALATATPMTSAMLAMKAGGTATALAATGDLLNPFTRQTAGEMLAAPYSMGKDVARLVAGPGSKVDQRRESKQLLRLPVRRNSELFSESDPQAVAAIREQMAAMGEQCTDEEILQVMQLVARHLVRREPDIAQQFAEGKKKLAVDEFLDKSKWKDHPKKANYVVSLGGLVRTKAWLDARLAAQKPAGRKKAKANQPPPVEARKEAKQASPVEAAANILLAKIVSKEEGEPISAQNVQSALRKFNQDLDGYQQDHPLNPKTLAIARSNAKSLLDGFATNFPASAQSKKKEYVDALAEAFSRIPDRALVYLTSYNVNRVGGAEGLTHSSGARPRAFYQGSIYGKNSSVNVDIVGSADNLFSKLFESIFSKDAANSPTSVFVHELAHAIDGPFRKITESPEWKAAIGKDGTYGTLGYDPKNHSSETFAEFARRVWAGRIPLREIERVSPNLSSLFKKLGFWPTAEQARDEERVRNAEGVYSFTPPANLYRVAKRNLKTADWALGHGLTWALTKIGQGGAAVVRSQIGRALGRMLAPIGRALTPNLDYVAGGLRRGTLGYVHKTGGELRADIGSALTKQKQNIAAIWATTRDKGLVQGVLTAGQRFTGYFYTNYKKNVAKYGVPVAATIELTTLTVDIALKKILMPLIMPAAGAAIGGVIGGYFGHPNLGAIVGSVIGLRAGPWLIKMANFLRRQVTGTAARSAAGGVTGMIRRGMEAVPRRIIYGKRQPSAVQLRKQRGGLLELPTSGAAAGQTMLPGIAAQIAKKYRAEGKPVPAHIQAALRTNKRHADRIVIHAEDRMAEIMNAIREQIAGLYALDGITVPPISDEELLPFLAAGVEGAEPGSLAA
jgi:hypothetical protein